MYLFVGIIQIGWFVFHLKVKDELSYEKGTLNKKFLSKGVVIKFYNNLKDIDISIVREEYK